jgi:hypothetical protein
MLRLDQRTEEQIEILIDWSQADPFWRGNILSMSKLREQFDALVLKSPSHSRGVPQLREDIFTDNPATRMKRQLESD